jgi:hypothetical protein
MSREALNVLLLSTPADAKIVLGGAAQSVAGKRLWMHRICELSQRSLRQVS